MSLKLRLSDLAPKPQTALLYRGTPQSQCSDLSILHKLTTCMNLHLCMILGSSSMSGFVPKPRPVSLYKGTLAFHSAAANLASEKWIFAKLTRPKYFSEVSVSSSQFYYYKKLPKCRTPVLIQRKHFVLLSHVMRKPVFAICKQQRRRSAWASAQSDLRLCCSLPR